MTSAFLKAVATLNGMLGHIKSKPIAHLMMKPLNEVQDLSVLTLLHTGIPLTLSIWQEQEPTEKGLKHIYWSCCRITEVEFYRGRSPLSFDQDRKPDALHRKSLDGRRPRELTHFTAAVRAF